MSKEKKLEELIEKIEKRRKEIREERRMLDLCGKILGKERSLENIDKVIRFLFEQGFKEEYIEAIVLGAQFFFSPSWLPPLDEKVIEEETEKFAKDVVEYKDNVFAGEFIRPILKEPDKYSEEEQTKIFSTCINFTYLLTDRGFSLKRPKPDPEFTKLVAALFMLIKICLRSMKKSSC